ncbi:PIN domain-containing protein [Candidatus Poribacteria bacterium]|nr:PIN domain-containing protein [Candidatus Poribacteria bacterium]MYH82610.1 PIN domain-containing protein [Candidatus Poribacteria bacterium]MYK96935.1 PIN domain-containing protein [Candidatus Poribacteria bacterium]
MYLDTCCLNRLFNDQTQARIHQETEAVKIILARFFTTQWQWLISTALVNEISKTPNKTLRTEMEMLLDLADQNVPVGIVEIARGTQLESLGFKWLDALHIACAESGRADILLTTDDRMLRRAKRFRLQLRVRVENPYTWLEEISKHEHTKAAGR